MEAALSIHLHERFVDKDNPHALIVLPFNPRVNTRLESNANRFVKRSVDLILGSFLTLALLSWILPLVAILIRLDSRGPVFFLQKRNRLRKKTFYCFKFRSMVVNNQSDRLAVQPGDKRITRVGRILRKYHIDELPQLLNVLIGDMSLVGPRPHMLRHTVIYSRIVKDYQARLEVKPGIAGLAQMRGHHGTIHNRQDLYNRCSSDFEYIETWTMFGDLYIFFRTIYHIIKSL
jgi:putative colanic acid biosysnthesis UDP-glucose lipid carrier transferase